MTQAEAVMQESAAPIEADKDDVEKLTDKFSKLVDEAYVIKEGEPDAEEKAKSKFHWLFAEIWWVEFS